MVILGHVGNSVSVTIYYWLLSQNCVPSLGGNGEDEDGGSHSPHAFFDRQICFTRSLQAPHRVFLYVLITLSFASYNLVPSIHHYYLIRPGLFNIFAAGKSTLSRKEGRRE
jgi:hypothetical protein